MNEVHLIIDEDGDWMGVYVNGKLVIQGHETSISLVRVFEAIKDLVQVRFCYTYQCLYDGLYDDLTKQLLSPCDSSEDDDEV